LTTDSRTTLEGIAGRIPMPEPAYQRFQRRRDRRRRTQRITAGVVGFGFFLSAILIVTTTLWTLDPARTPVSGGAETGPAETGPTTTGPTQPGGFDWPPPEGTEPSTPAIGEWIAGEHEIHPWSTVRVYADGRVIWLNQDTVLDGWLERRLTPAGVGLVRSGAVEVHGQDSAPLQALPAHLWEDAAWKPYIPSRYVACAARETIRLLPRAARDLLRDYESEQALASGENDFSSGGAGATCPAVTIEAFRSLDRILLHSGWSAHEEDGTLTYHYGDLDAQPAFVGGISVIGLLPDGTFAECCPG